MVTPLPIDPIAEARRQWTEHGWSDAAPGMAAITSIMRVQQLVLARVEAVLKPFDLSFARYEVLRLLAFTRTGSMPLGSAASRLQLHPTSVSSTVARLERAGLVVRTAHPTDGRAVMLTITEAGRAAADDATERLNAEVFLSPGLDDDDLGALVGMLARFRKNAGDFGDPPHYPDPL